MGIKGSFGLQDEIDKIIIMVGLQIAVKMDIHSIQPELH